MQIYISMFIPGADGFNKVKVIQLPAVPRVGEFVEVKNKQLRVTKVRYLPEGDENEQVDIWVELP